MKIKNKAMMKTISKYKTSLMVLSRKFLDNIHFNMRAIKKILSCRTSGSSMQGYFYIIDRRFFIKGYEENINVEVSCFKKKITLIAMPREIQEIAYEKGVIPYIHADKVENES